MNTTQRTCLFTWPWNRSAVNGSPSYSDLSPRPLGQVTKEGPALPECSLNPYANTQISKTSSSLPLKKKKKSY